MDKKNTMLLTVIAVATLLVAVVGATFAFFAIQTDITNNSSKTTVTGGTESVVTAPIALKGTSNLKLELSDEDMSRANIGYYYYAGADGRVKGNSAEEGNKAEDHKVTVGTVTVGQSGSADVTYKCTANYTIKIDKVDGEAIQFNDENDDAVLTLYDGDGVVVNTSGGFASAKTGISLKDLTEAGADGLSGTVDFTIKSESGQDATKELQASLRIKNSDQQQESYLAGKSFNITIEATTFNCDTVAGN